jgi:hypothetical protein
MKKILISMTMMIFRCSLRGSPALKRKERLTTAKRIARKASNVKLQKPTMNQPSSRLRCRKITTIIRNKSLVSVEVDAKMTNNLSKKKKNTKLKPPKTIRTTTIDVVTSHNNNNNNSRRSNHRIKAIMMIITDHPLQPHVGKVKDVVIVVISNSHLEVTVVQEATTTITAAVLLEVIVVEEAAIVTISFVRQLTLIGNTQLVIRSKNPTTTMTTETITVAMSRTKTVVEAVVVIVAGIKEVITVAIEEGRTGEAVLTTRGMQLLKRLASPLTNSNDNLTTYILSQLI